MKFTQLPARISPETANKIVQVLNVFESGTKEGRYDAWVAYKDFTYKGENYRQITYGKSQTTEFGNLKSLLQMYVANNGLFAAELLPYIAKIGKIKNGIPQSLFEDAALKSLLKRAATDDPVMRDTQDVFFDRYYFQPALAFFTHHQFSLPLSLLVIYDSFIHSGGILSLLRQRFPELPPLAGGNEKTWIEQYTKVRHDWLTNHSKPVVRSSNYRTLTLKKLIADGNWNLTAEFKTQGIVFE